MTPAHGLQSGSARAANLRPFARSCSYGRLSRCSSAQRPWRSPRPSPSPQAESTERPRLRLARRGRRRSTAGRILRLSPGTLVGAARPARAAARTAPRRPLVVRPSATPSRDRAPERDTTTVGKPDIPENPCSPNLGITRRRKNSHLDAQEHTRRRKKRTRHATTHGTRQATHGSAGRRRGKESGGEESARRRRPGRGVGGSHRRR